jgi:hypothetical protein
MRQAFIAIFATILVALYALPASRLAARWDGAAYVLTEQERAQWSQFDRQEQELAKLYDQSILLAVNTPIGEGSQSVHGAVQGSWLKLNLVRTQRNAMLMRLQLDHDCKDCSVIDGKLIKPPPKEGAK